MVNKYDDFEDFNNDRDRDHVLESESSDSVKKKLGITSKS